jgi:cell division transport system ATP-binding protein
VIEFQAVKKEYPPSQVALHHLDLSVKQGEFVFLVGASGAGKSTLMKLLYGAERISQGRLHVAGHNVSAIEGNSLAMYRREIGVVFQDFKLLNRRSVISNISFPLEIRGVSKSKMSDSALKLLKFVGLENRAESLPETLSGGEQQRVAIARALITRPKLILADEPTGNLDPAMSKNVLQLLLEANKTGTTVLMATHNLPLIEELKLRTIVLDRGRIIGDFASPKGIN